jgi:hypothetical protein
MRATYIPWRVHARPGGNPRVMRGRESPIALRARLC